MDIKEKVIQEWFYRLPKGYAEPPYSTEEMRIFHEVLSEHIKESPDILDQAFLDADPVDKDLEEQQLNLREVLINIGDKTYQLSKAEIDQITGYLEKDMNKKDFKPMSRAIKTASGKSTIPVKRRMIGKFAEEEHWQEWLSSVEGIIPDKKLQKLYFTLYDITSATYTAKYIDEVLDELYNIDANVLAKELFSISSPPLGESGYSVPTEFYGMADIGTVRGGSKGTEMGRGELIIPFLFNRGELGGANAIHDVDINGKGWHVKELKTKNSYIRLGLNTYANSNLAKTLSKVGLSKSEFSLVRVKDEDGNLRQDIIDALNDEYGNVNTAEEGYLRIQEELDTEMREMAIATGNGQGLIFYVPADQKLYFAETEDCISGGATQGAHTVGYSHSGRSVGLFAAEAEKI